MQTNKIVAYLIKFVWFVTFMLIVFLDRKNPVSVYLSITLLIIISSITIIRSINSRNEWRKMIEDGEVEIKDKISFDD